MAKLDGPGDAFTRSQAIRVRPTYLLKTWKGQPIIQKWPRPRRRATTQLQQAWIDAFSNRARGLKTPLPELYTAAIEAAKNTGWYYRDVLERASYGKLYVDDGERRVTTPTARVYSTTATSIPNGVATPLHADTSLWDNNGFWTNAQPTRFTFQAPGLYLIGAECVIFTNSGTNNARFQLRLNGSTFIVTQGFQGTQGSERFIRADTLYYFHPGDYIEPTFFKGAAGNTVILDSLWTVGITPEVIF